MSLRAGLLLSMLLVGKPWQIVVLVVELRLWVVGVPLSYAIPVLSTVGGGLDNVPPIQLASLNSALSLLRTHRVYAPCADYNVGQSASMSGSWRPWLPILFAFHLSLSGAKLHLVAPASPAISPPPPFGLLISAMPFRVIRFLYEHHTPHYHVAMLHLAQAIYQSSQFITIHHSSPHQVTVLSEPKRNFPLHIPLSAQCALIGMINDP